MTNAPWKHVAARDVHGLLRLAADATVGVVDIVEAMHHTISRGTAPLGRAPSGTTIGITGGVYRIVRGSARWVGHGIDAAGRLFAGDGPAASSPQREAWVAAVNGVWGDHLAAQGNPLAIPLALRRDGRPLDLAQLAGRRRVAVFVHGLCMNDLQWQRQGADHSRAVEDELGFASIHLHYNSGRHVSDNGRDFAAALEALADAVPIDELVIVGHSMGGLVARSACHQAAQAGMRWPRRLTKLVFLGTPHQGAPLERGGRLIDSLLGVSPYVAPFAKLGRARSAGITDLRYGNLQPADWQGRDRHAQRRDDRVPTPLPAGVEAYAVAATKSPSVRGLKSALLGDGLVPVASAFGEHADAAHALRFAPQHRLVLTQANHWDLLSRPEVGAKLLAWLA